MKKWFVSPVPQAAGCGLAFLSIVILLLAHYGVLHATNAPPSPDPTPIISNMLDQLVWVREDAPIINVNNDPLRYEAEEERFAGSFTQYEVTETSIAMEERYVDHGYEWYHVTLTNTFNRPPLVLNPPLRYKVSANFTHGGVYRGGGMVGAQFWYASDDIFIEPREVLPYYPWAPNFDGTNSKAWMIPAPSVATAGATFQLTAGWWNCPPCNITWTYRAEPANAVEQLGVQVVEPVVTYQGEEVPPGEMFFPDTCSALTSRGAAGECNAIITSTGAGEAYYACFVGGVNRVLMILNRAEIDQLKHELVLYVALARIAESCQYTTRTADNLQLGLVLQQGAMTLSNVVNGQAISVDTPLGMATAVQRGVFLTAYNPDTSVAIFRAYSAPLVLQPQTGEPVILQPPHEVQLTAAGFGPISMLPHTFLPVLIK